MKHTWGVIELHFQSKVPYCNPYRDVDLFVDFTSQGQTIRVTGFWDGENDWRVRFAPPSPGIWHWKTACSDEENRGLHSCTGMVQAVTYEGTNPIYKHGFLAVNENSRGFMHKDKTPFFWLGDTVWSVSAHTTLEEWMKYVRFRSEQGFNVVQINTLPQWDASIGPARQPFYSVESNETSWDLFRPNPVYFQLLDNICETSVEAGLLVALVVLWCNYVPYTNPNWADLPRNVQFDERSASRYAQYLEARYGAFGAIWIISGDTDYSHDTAISIYEHAAQAIIESSPYQPLITAHLNGGICTSEILNRASWLTFHMFQSCHTPQSVRNAVMYAEQDRAYKPVRPVLNGEPCYDNIQFLFPGDPIGRSERNFVRKTAWVSILSGATAGLTYGAHGLWPWHREGQKYNQLQYGLPDPWEIALHYDSAGDFVHLKTFFEGLDWWDLAPSQHLVKGQTENTWVASTPGYQCVVVYSTDYVPLHIDTVDGTPYEGQWSHPENGFVCNVRLENKDGCILVGSPPWNADRVLLLKRI